jgi:4-carboxymuconolactone decarboxylase
MDLAALREIGLKTRKEIFGPELVESRMDSLGEFGAPLQQLINGFGYGELWNRPGLPRKLRSLVTVAMLAAANRPNELRLHLGGALANGCTAEEIREVLLHLAMYCGVPASLDAHKIAFEVLSRHGEKPAPREAAAAG